MIDRPSYTINLSGQSQVVKELTRASQAFKAEAWRLILMKRSDGTYWYKGVFRTWKGHMAVYRALKMVSRLKKEYKKPQQ